MHAQAHNLKKWKKRILRAQSTSRWSKNFGQNIHPTLSNILHLASWLYLDATTHCSNSRQIDKAGQSNRVERIFCPNILFARLYIWISKQLKIFCIQIQPKMHNHFCLPKSRPGHHSIVLCSLFYVYAFMNIAPKEEHNENTVGWDWMRQK